MSERLDARMYGTAMNDLAVANDTPWAWVFFNRADAQAERVATESAAEAAKGTEQANAKYDWEVLAADAKQLCKDAKALAEATFNTAVAIAKYDLVVAKSLAKTLGAAINYVGASAPGDLPEPGLGLNVEIAGAPTVLTYLSFSDSPDALTGRSSPIPPWILHPSDFDGVDMEWYVELDPEDAWHGDLFARYMDPDFPDPDPEEWDDADRWLDDWTEKVFGPDYQGHLIAQPNTASPVTSQTNIATSTTFAATLTNGLFSDASITNALGAPGTVSSETWSEATGGTFGVRAPLDVRRHACLRRSTPRRTPTP